MKGKHDMSKVLQSLYISLFASCQEHLKGKIPGHAKVPGSSTHCAALSALPNRAIKDSFTVLLGFHLF